MSSPQTAVSIVGRHLSTLVLNGELKAGGRLPPERQLAHELGVSRQKIREGINHLGARGILKRCQGIGTFVAVDVNTLTTLAPLPRVQSQTLEVHLVLEPYVISLAAKRASKEHVAALAYIVRNMFRALDDVDTFRKYDLEFHRVLIQACGNPFLVSLMEECGGGSSMCCGDGVTFSCLSDLADFHRRIYRAVRARDPLKTLSSMEALSRWQPNHHSSRDQPTIVAT